MKRCGYVLGTIVVLAGAIGVGCGDTGESAGVVDDEASASEQAYAAATDRPPTTPPEPNTETKETLLGALPSDTPAYFAETYLSMMGAPLPSKIYDLGGVPPVVPKLEVDPDPFGRVGSYQPGGATVTRTNAFFQSLGSNGRSCVTCHQPPSGMGVSVRNIKRRLAATDGTDPIFAPVDGANCPNQVQRTWTSGALYGGTVGHGTKSFRDAHSLLIEKGLIRIPLAVPADAEFTIEVVSDPTTCNIDPVYSTTADGRRIVSVFRRPLIAGNLHFKTTTLDFFPPGTSPLTNIMVDGREPTLFTQAVSATLGHAQATRPPTQEQLNQIVAFETGIFNAQLRDDKGGALDVLGATGGPVHLSRHGADAPAFGPAFDEFGPWSDVVGVAADRRRSIARGQKLFMGVGGQDGTRGQFALSNVAGFNDFPGIPPVATGSSCATCHNFAHAGSDILARSQRDIGTGGHGTAVGGPSLARDLPVFKLTCPAGSFLWDPSLTTVTTNDPSKALITGKCRDIGARTVPSLRGLASREPYFIDGSASSLLELVNVYDRRFAIGFTSEEKRDLVNFLNAL